MDATESERLFKLADELYRAERYDEALDVLDRLDIAYPDTKNILMPRAMCLVHLGQMEPARAIYERLAARYPLERLSKLRKLLDTAEQPPSLDALDAVFNVNRAALEDVRITMTPQSVKDARVLAAQRAEPAGVNWRKWGLIGAGAVLVLALLSLPLFIQSDGSSTPRERPEVTRITADNMDNIPEGEWIRLGMVLLFVVLPLGLLSIPLPIYLTLLFFGELPKESHLLSYLILLGYMFLIYLVCGLVFGCLGMFLGAAASLGYIVSVLLTVNQIFELGWVRTLIFAGFTFGLMLFQGPLLTMILWLFAFEFAMG